MRPCLRCQDSDLRFLLGVTLLSGLLWACLYACKYYGLGLDNYDAGIYSNLAYNLAHGSPFYSSVLQKHHLGEHFSPIMLVFAPLYRLAPGVQWLLAAQLAAWLAVPWLLRLVLREGMGTDGKTWTIWLTLAWFLYQPVTAAMNFPFHPSTLAMPFIVWAFLEMMRGKWVRMAFLLAFLLTFKENLFLVWIGFGLYQVAARRNYVAGTWLMLAGALAGWLVLNRVMPLFQEGEWQHWTRFGPTYDWPHKLRYLAFMLAPLGLLPLINWRAGVLALPALLPNLGSQMTLMYSRRHHYDDVASALLFCALAVSLPLLRQRMQGRVSPRRGTAIAGAGFVLILAFADMTPLRAAWRHWPTRESVRLIKELRAFDHAHPTDFLYIPNALGVYFQRTLQAPLPEGVPEGSERYPSGSILLVAERADPDNRRRSAETAAYLSAHPETFEPLPVPALFRAYRVR